MHASGRDESTNPAPPMRLALDRALSCIQDDERVGITPKSIRRRKRWFDPNDRKKRERASALAKAVDVA